MNIGKLLNMRGCSFAVFASASWAGGVRAWASADCLNAEYALPSPRCRHLRASKEHVEVREALCAILPSSTKLGRIGPERHQRRRRGQDERMGVEVGGMAASDS